MIPKDRAALLLVALLIVALVLTVGLSSITYLVGRQLGSHVARTPTSLPTRPPPAVHTATATARPTRTSTPVPTSTYTATTTPTPTYTLTPTPTPRVIITEVRALGRLETTKFLVQTVIDLRREPTNIWEQVFGTDQLLLVASGEVVAGFDLAQVAPEHISVTSDAVSIVLPPSQILYSKLDNSQTYVYEQKTGLFRKPDKDIEGEARRLAEQAMQQRALEGRVLEQAELSGRVQIEAFLRSLGFEEVEIIVRGKGE